MAEILKQIGGPLQLAALALMLLAGLARLLVRSGKISLTPAMSRLLVNRVFALALVALVIGLASPLLAGFLPQPDTTYYGVVRSTTGGAIAGATVELQSGGQATTTPTGQFDLVVPRNRSYPEYRVRVSAPGYKPSPVLTRTASQMRLLEVELEPLARHLVTALEKPILLGQFFGSPFVLAMLRVENPTPAMALINDIRATLSGTDRTFTLQPATWTTNGQWGPYQTVFGPIQVPASGQGDLRILLTVPSNIGQLLAEIGALQDYKSARPCQPSPSSPAVPLTNEAFDLYQTFATQRFSWTEGSWALSLDVVGGGEARHFDAVASLSAADVSGLRNSIALGRNCLGVSFQAPIGQDGQLANFVVK